jgi:hypothetical protein
MPTLLPQDIKRTYWVLESTFATTPTSALSYLGEVFDLTPDFDDTPEEDQIENRAYTDVTFTQDLVGFIMKARVRAVSVTPAWNPVNFWALFALGATTGRAADGLIDSFSLVAKKANASLTEYALFNGCKMDGLQIAAPGVGKVITWQATCRCQYITLSTTKAFTGLQAVTVGADPTIPTTAFVRWDGDPLTINWGAGVVNLTGVETWALNIQNGIKPELGRRTGADALDYTVAEAFDEGPFDCTVDITRFHRDTTPISKKLAKTTGITLTLPIGDKIWTLTGGYFPKAFWPQHTRGKEPLKETFTLKFSGLTIASA